MGVGVLGRVEDGSVSSEANQHVRVFQLLLGVLKLDMLGKFQIAALQEEGQTHGGLHPHVPQNLFRGLGRPQAPVPVWVWAQYHFHCPVPSNAPCDASTRAERSPFQGSPAPTHRCPKYSMLPSGPRMGEKVISFTVKSAS